MVLGKGDIVCVVKEFVVIQRERSSCRYEFPRTTTASVQTIYGRSTLEGNVICDAWRGVSCCLNITSLTVLSDGDRILAARD